MTSPVSLFQGSLVMTAWQLCHLCWAATITSSYNVHYTSVADTNTISNYATRNEIDCVSHFQKQANPSGFFRFDKASGVCTIGTVDMAAVQDTASPGLAKVMLPGTRTQYVARVIIFATNIYLLLT